MGRADQGTVIHASLLVMLTTGSRQFVEQHLCVLQIGGVEALGEPAVNGRQQLARFGPPALFGPQLGEGSSQRAIPMIGCCFGPVRNCEISQLTTIPANELYEPPGPGDGISYSPFSAC